MIMKKLLSLLLGISICLGLLALATFAAEAEPPSISIYIEGSSVEAQATGLAPNTPISFQGFYNELRDYLGQPVTDAEGAAKVSYVSTRDFVAGDVIKVIIGGGGLAVPLEATYTIEAELFTVIFVDWDETVLDEQLVEHGDVAAAPEDPFRPGYTFIGWMLDGEVFDFETAITENIVLVASWELIPITSLRINAAIIETVARGGKYNFGVIVNEGAIAQNIIWTLSNSALGRVDEAGNVTIFERTGTVVLQATDPVSGISNSVMLRIAS